MDRLTGYTTLTSASRRLGVTVLTLRAWIDKGLVRAVRDDSGRRLLLREDVDRIAGERAARSKRDRRGEGPES